MKSYEASMRIKVNRLFFATERLVNGIVRVTVSFWSEHSKESASLQ